MKGEGLSLPARMLLSLLGRALGGNDISTTLFEEATEADWQAELDKSLTANAKNKEDEKKIRAFFEERKEHILATLNERKVFDFLKKEAVVK